MATIENILVPDIGTSDDVDVIDILVSPGDVVAADDPLITLESDKASMDVPAPIAGTVKDIKVSVGDKIKEGGLIAVFEVASEAVATDDTAPQEELEVAESTPAAEAHTTEQNVLVPDIGTTDAVDVIEVNVKVGDEIQQDDAIITLESDKASMEVPASHGGIVKALQVKVGDQVKADDVILVVTTTAATTASAPKQAPAEQPAAKEAETKTAAPVPPAPAAAATSAAALPDNSDVHAGPAVRRLARELGVDLHKAKGTGRKGRLILEDVHQYVKSVMQQAQSGSSLGLGLPKAPVIDFTKFGDISVQPLSKIKKISGANLQRNWMMIPHVTQFDEADITELEDFRKTNKAIAEKQGYKLTPLTFIMKAVVASLKAFPTVNASLDESNENLILKNYYHIGVAVDTPNGLVVPVIRDVDQKSVMDLAKELGEVSVKARDGKLTLNDMQGASFTISSLGGISGIGFTPIVNLPEVAILGVSRSSIKPVYQSGEFVPRLMLPLSFSYDHRVIDGAEAARFTKHLSMMLSDLRRILL